MCQPMVNGAAVGSWVPLGSITWSYLLAAYWSPAAADPSVLWSSVIVSGQAATDGTAYAFQQTTQFPTWSQIVPSPQKIARL